MRTSAARHSARPPPTAGPFTAATTGCGSARIACGSDAIVSWNRRRSMAGSVGVEHARPEVAQVDARAEAPPGAGEHDGPDVAVDRDGRRTSRVSSPSSTSLIALSRSGRLSRTRATPSLGCSTASVLGRGHTRSITVAVPMPPPVHIVTRPVVRSWRSSSSRSGADEHRARRPDRVAERDRAAVDVHALGIEAEVAHRLERHRGERLVDLPEVDVAGLHPRLGEAALGGGAGRGQHDHRLRADRRRWRGRVRAA